MAATLVVAAVVVGVVLVRRQPATGPPPEELVRAVDEMRTKMDELAGGLSQALERAEQESRRNRLFGEIGNSIDLEELMDRVLDAAMEIEGVDAAPLLKACSDDAVAVGLDELAAKCFSGAAELGPDLLPRAAAARRAHALDPGAVPSVYAMYSVAVDAYNAGQYGLAEDLAVEVGPVAGDLSDAVTAVLEAARRARVGG